MYNIQRIGSGSIERNTSKEGETIERTFERLKNGNETKMVGKETIYTRPEDGVVYGTDIRQDRFDKALENAERVTNHIRTTRDKKLEDRKKTLEELKNKGKNDGKNEGGESVQAVEAK